MSDRSGDVAGRLILFSRAPRLGQVKTRLEPDLSALRGYEVLHYREAESCAAFLSGACRIHTVESLEHALLVDGWSVFSEPVGCAADPFLELIRFDS